MGRGVLLASALVVAAAAVALLALATASACPVKYCTDETGFYELVVPPISPSDPFLGEYHDCVWDVHVEFGDGTQADYKFDGDVGLSGSHTYLNYGRYNVVFLVYPGVHKGSGYPCLGLRKETTIAYQSAGEIAQEKEAKELEEREAQEAKERAAREAREAKEKAAKERAAKEKGSSKGGSGGSQGSGGDGNGPSHPIVLWRNCRGEVYAHLVACKKARKVIKGAQGKLSGRKAAKVAGFSCHLTEELRPISCRRGKGRVIGPLS